MLRRFSLFFSLCFVLGNSTTWAQATDGDEIKQWLMKEISALADTSMHGRGYVKEGRVTASAYMQKRFQELGLKTVSRKKTYTQPYEFSVNTFPGRMDLIINGTRLEPGRDFIIDAASPGYSKNNLELKTIDMALIKEQKDWEETLKTFKAGHTVYYLKNIDIGCKILDFNKRFLPTLLPAGRYIVPEKEKLTWDVARELVIPTIFYVKEDAMPSDTGTVSIHADQEMLNDIKSENVIGYVPGEIEDSFVVVTAHYDHLGMMGDAIFPGASDNASGSAMLLYMANYFVAHPQHFSVMFIAFSGEEPGLLGSLYYTKHPVVMMGKIKFLTNVDIMGDATDGVTVVNATEFPEQFELMKRINREHHYLPQVKSRGKAANSDHYHFSQKGVPAFFLYSNGGKGYYHDVFDKAVELSLNHVDDVAHLLIDFISAVR